ncbi:MAG: hypothetical protein AMK73_08920, partial [Planctomycetes bacterium SM23_32]
MPDKPTGTELAGGKWVEMLSKRARPSRERVVVTGRFSRSVSIKKEDWGRHFRGWGGIAFRNGCAVEMVPAATGGARAPVPEWARQKLGLAAGDLACVSQRDGKAYLKKLDLVERPTAVPGTTVVDSFKPLIVTREYALNTSLDGIAKGALRRLLPLMGRFRRDPLAPFRAMDGLAGILGRRDLLGGMTAEDQAALAAYRRGICDEQLEDGSWAGNVVTTAYSLIRLREAGAAARSRAVRRGVQWLLATPEPLGFPGLFMLTPKLAERFSAWKARQ